MRPTAVRLLALGAVTGLLLTACATGSATPDTSVAAVTPSAVTVTQVPAATTQSPTTQAIPVVTSTNVYGDIVSRIGGDRVAVTSIISEPGQDPHSYEANSRTQLELSKARLVVSNGGGYDDFVATMLGTAGGEHTVLDAVEVSGHKAAAGNALNEHVWYDLPAMSTLAGRIADALTQVEPSSAGLFRVNAEAFRATLAILTAREADLRSGHSGAKIAITEPVPLYLLEACGLQNVTPPEFSEAIEEGTDVPARVLADALALIESGTVKALVYNEQTAGPQTEQLRTAAQRKGVPIVGVTETLPTGKSYLDWMGATLDAVRDALGKVPAS